MSSFRSKPDEETNLNERFNQIMVLFSPSSFFHLHVCRLGDIQLY